MVEEYQKQNTESDSDGESIQTDEYLISEMIKLN